MRYAPLIILLMVLNSCESERSACDCYKTADDVIKKIRNGEIPNDLAEAEIQEKYLKGCEWTKEVNDDVLANELKDCPEYKRKEE